MNDAGSKPHGTNHGPEYLTEAAGLGVFMLSASCFAVLLFHPGVPLAAFIPEGLARNAVMGMAMALTSLVLVYNRWGMQSGAHFNPAFTLTFWRLGKIASRDAKAYIVAQFLGGAVGMLVAAAVLAKWLPHPAVRYVVTTPGPLGAGVAWLAEFLMTALLMGVVLTVSNRPCQARFTGIYAAGCVGLFITFESPLSGMSLNPARSFASALAGGDLSALWIYFTAPPLGMLFAAEAFVAVRGRATIRCAKLHHANTRRCIFCEHHSPVTDALKPVVRIPEAARLTGT